MQNGLALLLFPVAGNELQSSEEEGEFMGRMPSGEMGALLLEGA